EAAYTVETAPEAGRSLPGASARVEADGSVTVETDLYRIRLDPARGGSLSSLFAKQWNREFCQSGERRFHEFRGYFIEEKNWASGAAQPAKLEVLESGPIRVTVAVSGLISSIPFRTSLSLTQGEPRIGFHTQFRFEKDTWIGDPWEIKPELRMTGRRRSEYDDSYKLLALFPAALERAHIYKNAAFDVCKSQNSNTFFQTWDTIKHNIAVNWVDLVDEKEEFGLALLTDHTTSYAHGEDHPLSLVLGWGWDRGFWWCKCPLKGLQEARYSIVPHAGRWDQAALWRRSAEMAEPLLARVSSGGGQSAHPSLVRVESPGLTLTSMTMSGRDLLLRFFNAESPDNDHEISLGIEPKLIELVELDGRVSQRLRPSAAVGGGLKIKLHVPRFGVRTVRLSGF
ncbi:MAG: glycoside hydrolase, partial [Acidobacteriota bacterium]|nr:glycoside hydrolase [Acidobacteriota bacterium]